MMECFLVDGIVRLRQTIQIIILTLFTAPWRRKKLFLVDGSVKGRLRTRTSLPCKDNMEEKEMIPGGWNRQREASNN